MTISKKDLLFVNALKTKLINELNKSGNTPYDLTIENSLETILYTYSNFCTKSLDQAIAEIGDE